MYMLGYCRIMCLWFMGQIGGVSVGSEHPIALQTMTTTDTRNVAATVEQVSGQVLLFVIVALMLVYWCILKM